MPSFQHPLALVESSFIGGGTQIQAFSHILPGARIGTACNIGDHTYIENDVVIGDRVTVKSGVQIWDGTDIGDDVFIGPNTTFANDAMPRTRTHAERTRIGKGASIGANATILSGVAIGERAMVGPGSVVTLDVPTGAIVTGNPAHITGYTNEPLESSSAAGISATPVQGVTIHRLPCVADLRGSLSFGEVNSQIPFPVNRYFLVFDVSNEQVRGEHAHRTLQQFLICAHGSCHVVADDGTNRQEFTLDQPYIGLYLPPMTWALQHKYSSDGVLLVLASDSYNPADYIRDYEEFLALRQVKA